MSPLTQWREREMGAGWTAGLGWPALMHPARSVGQGPGASEWREARGGTREGRFLRCKARQHLRASIPHDVHLPLVTQLLHLSSVNNGRGSAGRLNDKHAGME